MFVFFSAKGITDSPRFLVVAELHFFLNHRSSSINSQFSYDKHNYFLFCHSDERGISP